MFARSGPVGDDPYFSEPGRRVDASRRKPARGAFHCLRDRPCPFGQLSGILVGSGAGRDGSHRADPPDQLGQSAAGGAVRGGVRGVCAKAQTIQRAKVPKKAYAFVPKSGRVGENHVANLKIGPGERPSQADREHPCVRVGLIAACGRSRRGGFSDPGTDQVATLETDELPRFGGRPAWIEGIEGGANLARGGNDQQPRLLGWHRQSIRMARRWI